APVDRDCRPRVALRHLDARGGVLPRRPVRGGGPVFRGGRTAVSPPALGVVLSGHGPPPPGTRRRGTPLSDGGGRLDRRGRPPDRRGGPGGGPDRRENSLE